MMRLKQVGYILFIIVLFGTYCGVASARMFPPAGMGSTCPGGTMLSWENGAVTCPTVLSSVCTQGNMLGVSGGVITCIPDPTAVIPPPAAVIPDPANSTIPTCGDGMQLTWVEGSLICTERPNSCMAMGCTPAYTCDADKILVPNSAGGAPSCLSLAAYKEGTLCSAGKVFAGISNGNVVCVKW